ncbi:sporulation protein YunB [Shouchella sp. JSM 1781072]|uniref:sporulation protein YunB n=1 Tax=Bacillaceae TaxID=186817 RepID=UPI000C083D73|nr:MULTISPECIES: sporulation protein YunB [Bacillaceae]UTR05519.1 sporulation protein YunB [Alkalihalobacillus sp. LMS6]
MRKRHRFQPIKAAKQSGAPLPFRYVLLFSSILFAILSIQGLWFVDSQLRPIISQIAHREMERVATYTIEQAMTEELSNMDMSEIFIKETNNDGIVVFLDVNTQKYNELMGRVQHRVHEVMNQIQRGEINSYGDQNHVVATIPLGRAFNNALLTDVGPGIPVRFALMGDAKVQMRDEAEALGINNTRLSFYVNIDVNMDVILPFSETSDTISVELPAGFAYVAGPVPQFYGGQGGFGYPVIGEEDMNQEEMNEQDVNQEQEE